MPDECEAFGDVNRDETINFTDIQIVVAAFRSVLLGVPFEDVNIQPCGGNETANFADVQWAVIAFRDHSSPCPQHPCY